MACDFLGALKEEDAIGAIKAIEIAGEGGDVGKADDGFTGDGQVRVVFDAESTKAVEAFVAEDVAVVHEAGREESLRGC